MSLYSIQNSPPITNTAHYIANLPSYRIAFAKSIGHGDVKDDMVTMTEFQVVQETI